MQQTLLALLALMIASLLNFNQMQAHLRREQQAVRAELQQMALGVAMESMEVVRARAFDAATVGVPEDSTVDVSNFTDTPFSTGNKCTAFGGTDTCDDVDDFHEMVPAKEPFDLPDAQFEFRIEIEVRYVDDNLQPTGGAKTRWKEVIISVQDVQNSGTSLMVKPITFSEVLAYT